MRRSRTVDWVLLATLLPLYAAVQVVGIREYRKHEGWYFPFSVTGAQGPAGYPFVDRVSVPGCPLRVGDRVLRIEDAELRGLPRIDVNRAQAPLLAGGRPYRVEVERAGQRVSTMVAPAVYPYWWLRILGGVSLALAGTFLLVRSPHWHLSRRFFVSMLLIGSWGAADLATPHIPVAQLALPVGLAIGLWNTFEWTEAARPLRAWQRALPWALGLIQFVALVTYVFLTIPAGLIPYRLAQGVAGLLLLLQPVALSRAYWLSGSLERRQLRWVLYGISLATLPYAVLTFFVAVGVQLNFHAWNVSISALGAAIPLGIVVSIVGYHWLDIDRLISATTALTLLGIALLGAAVALVPRIAASTSSAVGLAPEPVQIALSMGLAALVVPAYRALRPWLDRQLFAEQHARALGFERLRAELAECTGVEALATRAGEGIDALLHPDSIATYARVGEAFGLLFVRGRAAPPAFEAKGALVDVLEAKGAPLFARTKGIAPFERAALETLGAELVVPVLREGRLVAFSCLAGKRSGDIYTATDLAHLAGVAERCVDVLARLDADAVAKEARELQAALRRYVPGAVAQKLVEGEALAPGEREVSVLFVDLRGYTGLAEELRPEEVFSTLNEHTERVSALIEASGGTVVEFNGDGMMAVFGAPEPLAKKEQLAVEAARRIVDTLPARLAVGVGVATGSAFVGSIRASDRFIWTAVGSTTNLAARLQALTRELDAAIAVDPTTRERAGYLCIDFVRHEDVAIRGRTGRLDVFALLLRTAAA